MAFVPNGESQGQTATWLLYTADEHGVDRKLIKTVKGGFDVPDALLTHLAGHSEPADKKTPPPAWDEPLPKSEVVFEGLVGESKVYLKDDAVAAEIEQGTVVVEDAHEVDREVIRAWLQDNGYSPAEKGALKKAHLEAYHAAN